MGDGVPVWLCVLVGALLLAVGGLAPHLTSRAARGELPRNPWVGLRTPGTVATDAGWRAGHAAAARWVAAAGAALALAGLGALLVGALGGSGVLFTAVVVAGAVVGAALLVAGAVRADAAGQRVSRGSGRRGGG